jgi:hypothetical protein
MDTVEEIRAMWKEWKTISFPADYAGKEVDGICVTSLDSYALAALTPSSFAKATWTNGGCPFWKSVEASLKSS